MFFYDDLLASLKLLINLFFTKVAKLNILNKSILKKFNRNVKLKHKYIN